MSVLLGTAAEQIGDKCRIRGTNHLLLDGRPRIIVTSRD
jgi:hypothetical protein